MRTVEEREDKKEKKKKEATNIVASWPPEHRPTGKKIYIRSSQWLDNSNTHFKSKKSKFSMEETHNLPCRASLIYSGSWIIWDLIILITS